jgi:hypothetical protein
VEYTVSEDTKNSILIIKASGMISTDVAEQMVLLAGMKLNITGFNRCLFDLVETQIDPAQTMAEMYMFIDAFKKAGIPEKTKMAALYETGGEYRSYLETAAAEHGFRLRHFKDQDKAERWLLN